MKKRSKYLGEKALGRYTHCFQDAYKKAYTGTMDFLAEYISPISLACIPVGMAMALSDCDGMREAGYMLVGAGVAEGVECIKKRGEKKERNNLAREVKRLRGEIKEIRQLEEEEIELLSDELEAKEHAA
ncbi:MAG: hypothetical protein DRO99_00255 [Candidatus Aenigmatarchaeota archaeon]|nr:MAG: hypothetical protein DRO99_00255 [Candidatus Aenigmarchaeota archaeon]